MATDTVISNLVINKLTREQYYDIENPSETEIYLVPDEIDDVPTENSVVPVKSGGVYTALAGKQDALASGTNIKTINSQSLLGSGNLSIEGAFIYTIDATGVDQTGTKTIQGSEAYDAIHAAYNAGKSVFVKWSEGENSNPYLLQLSNIATYQDGFEYGFSHIEILGAMIYTYNVYVSSTGCDLYYNYIGNVISLNNSISNVISISEADYNALTTKDSNTLYVITQ